MNTEPMRHSETAAGMSSSRDSDDLFVKDTDTDTDISRSTEHPISRTEHEGLQSGTNPSSETPSNDVTAYRFSSSHNMSDDMGQGSSDYTQSSKKRGSTTLSSCTADPHLSNKDITAEDPKESHSKRVKLDGDAKLYLLDEDVNFYALNIDEEGGIEPYDIKANERPPCIAIYHPAFLDAEKEVVAACKDFLKVHNELIHGGYTNEPLQVVCWELAGMQNLQGSYPAVGPVALFGPAGHGKSSFLNCILHQTAVAPESDASRRGTNIVHEYAAADAKQTALYVVTAPYFSSIAIESKVKTHCTRIFQYFKMAEENSEEDDLDDLQEGCETAIEFFHSLLCDNAEFESKEKTEEFFSEIKTEKEQNKTIKKLTKQVEELKALRTQSKGFEMYTAESNDELAKIYRNVSKAQHKKEGATPQPWPIIKKVKVQMDSDLLQAGVVLGDTAGITDTNQAVVEGSLNYLQSAGTILVFEHFSRITQSSSLDRSLRECIRVDKMEDTYLIVTMIDNCHVPGAASRQDMLPEDRKILEDAENYVEKLKKERKELVEAKKMASASERAKYESRLEDMPGRIALAKARIEQVAIEIRNRETMEELKGKFRKLKHSAKAPDLKVFFVSNTQYQRHLAGYDVLNPPSLDVSGTGIPDVRRMLYHIPARGKFNTLKRLCRSGIPKIFNGIIGILTQTPLERKQSVQQLLEATLRDRLRLINIIVVETERRFQELVREVFIKFDRTWNDKAERQLLKWRAYKPATFKAVCRRFGYWKQPYTKIALSWNNDIQEIYQGELLPGFDRLLDDKVPSIEQDFYVSVDDLFEEVERKLSDCDSFQGVSGSEAYFQYTQAVRANLDKDLQHLFRIFKNALGRIRNKCVIGGDKLIDDSYVAAFMAPTYEKCFRIHGQSPEVMAAKKAGKSSKGGPVHLTRVECIRQRFQGSGETASIFRSILAQVCADFKQAVNDHKMQTIRAFDSSAEELILDFDRRFNATEDEQDFDSPEVQRLIEAAHTAMGTLKGSVEHHLQVCEVFQKSDWKQNIDPHLV